MTNKNTKAALKAIRERRAEQDAKVHADMVKLATGDGRRLEAHLRANPQDGRALERHRQRGIAAGEPGW